MVMAAYRHDQENVMALNSTRLGISLGIAIIAGIVITYVSGFFRPLFPEMTVDVLQWGSPFPYLHRVVTFPGPAFVNWSMGAVDFIIWFLIVFAIVFVVWGMRKPAGKK
jgi:hypothetical protein